MKKLVILCAVVLAAFLSVVPIVGCQQAQETQPELIPSPPPQRPTIESRTYTNSEYNFSIDYPEDWDVLEDYMGMVFAFMGPLVLEETYYVNINLAAEQLPYEDMKLKDYGKAVELNTKRTSTDYKKVDEYSTTIGGQPAIVIVFTCTFEVEGTKFALKDSVAVFIKNNIGYTITYDVPEEFHDQYADCFD